ncbi:MAG: polysaccharide biosynthesis/export family protein [Desulfovermiculus sp.]
MHSRIRFRLTHYIRVGMKFLPGPGRALLLMAIAAMLAACAAPGPAVQTMDSNSKALQDLGQEQQSKVEEALQEKQTEEEEKDSRVSKALEQATIMTCREYLRSYGQSGEETPEYTIGPGDVIGIQIFDEPGLSRESVTVSDEGLINYPLIGRVKLGGLTTTQAEERVAEKMTDDQYLLAPHVSVQVKEYLSKEVLLLGAVKKSGTYQLKASETLLDIISRAGGVDFSRGGSELTLIRNEETPEKGEHKVAIRIDLDQLLDGASQYANLTLKNKDVLYIPGAKKFTVMGQVKDPGDYSLDNGGLSIVEAVGKAGGFTRIAAPNRAKIIRMTEDGTKVIQVNMNKLTQGDAESQSVPILPNDIIIVPESYF